MAYSDAPKPEEVLKRLSRVFETSGAMDLEDSYLTLVGVLLSARTRDEQVLRALSAFVEKFPTVQDLRKGSVEEIRATIATIGMNHQKAKHLKALAEKVCVEFDGKVPSTMDELVTLPGVGRKTASVVLSVVFDTPAIAVDVHVHRVAGRLNWSRAKLPPGTEKDLLELIPESLHTLVNRVFVKLGRYICIPRNPRCAICPLQDICPYKNKNLELPRDAEQMNKEWQAREEVLQTLREEVVRKHQKEIKSGYESG